MVAQSHSIANMYLVLLFLSFHSACAQSPESGPTALRSSVLAAVQKSTQPAAAAPVAPAKNTASSTTEVDVDYVTRMVDRFAAYTQKHLALADQFHTSEAERLEAAITVASDAADKSLLEVTATSNEESRLEAQNAINEMQNFVSTLKQSLGATGGTASCLDLTCGDRAYCDFSETEGARCVCMAGYQGDGFVCNPPTSLTSHALFQIPTPGLGSRSQAPQVADVSVTSLSNGKFLAVVYRDIGNLQRGYAMIGKVHPGGAHWRAPQGFSGESQAYGAQIKELSGPSGRLALAYRDQNRGGSGILVGGALHPKTQELILGTPKVFARNQARSIALLSLPKAHVAVIFPETIMPSVKNVVAASREASMHGAALLAKMDENGGAPEILGKHRFVSGPVARLSAIMLSPTTFVVAYRGSSLASSQHSEASAMWGQLRGTELVFDPHPVSLDSSQSQIWARDLSLVQENMFSYVYHSGNEQATKQAIVRVDPVTHRMTVLNGPQIVSHGFTSLVGTVQASVTQEASHTFSYFNDEGSGKVQARLCGVADTGSTTRCRNLDWGNKMIASASGIPVGDGRLVVVSTDPQGAPFYQFVGLLDSNMHLSTSAV